MGIVRKFIEFVRNKIITRRGFVPRHNNKDYGKVYFEQESERQKVSVYRYRVGDKYIDITFEFALELDPTQYEYVAFGEYPAGVIEEITNQTGYYGDIYRFCYCAAQMALEKMNPRT